MTPRTRPPWANRTNHWITQPRVIFVFLPLAFPGRWLFDLRGLFGASALANLIVALLAYRGLGARVDRRGE